jgi:hypothetical protein
MFLDARRHPIMIGKKISTSTRSYTKQAAHLVEDSDLTRVRIMLFYPTDS